MLVVPAWQPGAPVCLADSVDLDLTIANGVTKHLNSQKLSNIYGCAMAVDEIRFYVRPTTPTVVAGSTTLTSQFDFGQFILTKISVNNLNLMQNPVHISSLGELWQQELQWGGQKQTFITPTRHFLYNETYYSWKFPEPLWVGRQGALDIQIQAAPQNLRPTDPSAAIPNVTVHVAVVGRLQTITTPQMVAYPYVAEYASSGLSIDPANGVPAFAMVSDPVFRNPFFNPITIETLAATLYVPFSAAGGATNAIELFPGAVTMRLTDGRGNAIAGAGGTNPVPLGGFVDPRYSDWQINRVLDAYQFLYLELYANTNPNFAVDAQPVWWPRVAFRGTHLAQLNP